MLNKKIRFWRSLLFFADCLLLGLCWHGAYWLRFDSGWIPLRHDVPTWSLYEPALWLVPVLWLAFSGSLGLSDPRRRTAKLGEALALARATALFALTLTSASWLVFKLTYSRVFLVGFWCLATVSLLCLRLAFRDLIGQLRRRGLLARNVLVVGTDGLARQVRERLRLHPELGVNLLGFVTARGEEIGADLDGCRVLGDLQALPFLIAEHEIDEVFVAQSADLEDSLGTLLGELGEQLVDVSLVSDLCRHALLGGRVEDFEGMALLAVSNSPMIGWGSVAKRCFDLLLASLGLVLSAPLVLLAIVLVRLTSPGPVFYRQERFGLDGRRFSIHKIRTMIVDAEKDGPVWGGRNDPRVTRVGRLLRMTSIDELPQLWNVLRGDMSLVGPRPERPVFVERFQESVPRYILRHRVKPGITGWAQIHGHRGDTPADERLQYDLFYIRNWSVGLDVKILWYTAWGGFLNWKA